ncbi:undecaprenyldiphospho-muramoylpentapeptide beta-N-acetylglucosaminyltransferase [Hydrogenivirga sp. 128-5-R1-1]|uniref:undecaprenyldiphospho-muramoylpentapeptide beta-N-acetylglucosaminyltransferase n=1 Tax=Hydrogenivirga sp. 128-5-R1-1 TaxID=392423 RepID=UPI00015F0E03|nr:undecaprenyldiphospho-muramoylpentapeptide beta-N-acetylglucosaminyltransferase [Hydrogenivirga sp. 128-5-R1-1]EDP74260.1 phospho-N-acetylmuramoyl-pentapeptide-transferase [Hydrogenivirga sp. 128-5-R1-1]
MVKKVFIAGGGTGGHFYPALSVAKFLDKNGYEICYFGTKNGIESEKDFLGKKYLFDIKGVRGKGILNKPSSIYKLLKTAFKIKKIIKKEKPLFSICFGGYTSVPLGIASWLSGIDLYIHEQNSIPSYSNILLSKFAKKIFITFEYTKKYFPEEKTHLTGLPIRKSLLKRLSLTKEEARKILNINAKEKVVLIFGGSQGAKKLNEICLKLAEKHKDVIFINIQGKSKLGNISKNIIAFDYFEDMGLLYKVSDLVICRAGASTVNEILTFGKYAIFIPYPYAASNHQYYNVKWLEEKNLCKVITEENISQIYKEFENLLNIDFSKFEDKIRELSITDAEKRIYKELKNENI